MNNHEIKALLAATGCDTTPDAICTLLMALAASDAAKEGKHDTILVGAAEMIRAFEQSRKAQQDVMGDFQRARSR